MSRPSPLLDLFRQAQAFIAPYGPNPDAAVEIVETFGPLELEYAALRKHAILLDLPHRAVIEVGGPDRLDFLNRMLTQELKGMPPWSVRRSFWLNRKGRIDADLRVINTGDAILLECDVHAAARVVDGLGSYLVMEDATIRDRSEEFHRFALHGPRAAALLPHFCAPVPGSPGVIGLAEGSATRAMIGDSPVLVFRDDATGEPGFELLVPAAQAERIYRQFVEQAAAHDGHNPLPVLTEAARIPPGTLRPAGWHAFNIARIEAGTPLYLIDFGPDSLPAESGVLNDRVSFTKGCYLGQEIVARMHARGHPKRQLVAVRFETVGVAVDPETGLYPMPITGAELILESDPAAGSVGAITSCTLAPMLASSPIAFAQVKWEHAKPGVCLKCRVDRGELCGAIQESLRFWSRPER